MKTIRNSLVVIFSVYLPIILSHSFITANIWAFTSDRNQELPLLLSKSEDIVIYKKDIIVSPRELKSESKKDAKELKVIEKPAVKNLDTPRLDTVDKYLKEGKKYEARNLLSDFFINKKIPEKQKEIKELLDKLNEELIFSPLPSPDATIYTVQPGDAFSRIARQFNTNYELITRINGKSNTKLNVGEKLKVLTGKTKILISKRGFTLTLLLNGYYIKQYPICIGKDDKTPVGTFEVKNKMKEPTWYAPSGGVFPYGHKENILGTRWIGFKDKPALSGFGIHGTTQPESIGTASSNGCIRMVNSDVEELYDFVTLDTEIIIQG